MIVVTTPTGDIGMRVLGQVLDGGADVRLIARNPAGLLEGLGQRVEVIGRGERLLAAAGGRTAQVPRPHMWSFHGLSALPWRRRECALWHSAVG
ncbi:MAG: hypothetical protein ABJ215_09635 [Alphaproteobacteria bacterium]